VLVPVKPFGSAKSRLAAVCSPSEREALARAMLRNVVAAAHGFRIAIVAAASAQDVRRFALTHGARFLAEPEGGGLDLAVQAGVSQLAAVGYERVAVVHGDLPFATSLEWLANEPGITIVPDRRGDGTNALSIPTGVGFRFRYGPGSFERHCAEARARRIEPRVVVDPEGLSADVDLPEDLDDPSLATFLSSARDGVRQH